MPRGEKGSWRPPGTQLFVPGLNGSRLAVCHTPGLGFGVSRSVWQAANCGTCVFSLVVSSLFVSSFFFFFFPFFSRDFSAVVVVVVVVAVVVIVVIVVVAVVVVVVVLVVVVVEVGGVVVILSPKLPQKQRLCPLFFRQSTEGTHAPDSSFSESVRG